MSKNPLAIRGRSTRFFSGVGACDNRMPENYSFRGMIVDIVEEVEASRTVSLPSEAFRESSPSTSLLLQLMRMLAIRRSNGGSCQSEVFALDHRNMTFRRYRSQVCQGLPQIPLPNKHPDSSRSVRQSEIGPHEFPLAGGHRYFRPSDGYPAFEGRIYIARRPQAGSNPKTYCREHHLLKHRHESCTAAQRLALQRFVIFPALEGDSDMVRVLADVGYAIKPRAANSLTRVH